MGMSIFPILYERSKEMEIIKVEDSKKFIETFNINKISKEFLHKCKKSASLFITSDKDLNSSTHSPCGG